MNFQYISYSEQPIPLRSAKCKGAGQLVSPHYHEAMELILVENGVIDAFVNGRTFCCKAGDILLIPCNSVHRASSDDEGTVIKSLYFQPSFLRCDNPEIHPDKLLNRELAFPYLLEGELHENLRDTFLRIYNLSKTSSLHIADIMQMMAGLYTLLCEYVKLVPNDVDTINNFNRIAPAITYIKENLHRPIRLKELSELVFVCDDHLIRLFKRITHKTPSRYIMDARIENMS